jgi:hypothetical protein
VTTVRLALYALLGTLATAGGLVIVFKPGVILPPEAGAMARHLAQEQGALFVFVGIMLLWCFRSAAPRRTVHLALIAFLALFSGVHWAGYFDDAGGLFGAVGTAVPIVLLAATIPGRRA